MADDFSIGPSEPSGIPLSEVGPSPFDVSEAEPAPTTFEPTKMEFVTPEATQESRQYLADQQAETQTPAVADFSTPPEEQWQLNEFAPPRAQPNLPEYPKPTPIIDTTPLPSEEEARAAFDSITSEATPEDRQKAGDTVRRYLAGQKEEAARHEFERIKGQYRDDKGLLELSKDERMRQAMDISMDPQTTLKSAINENFLERWRRRPLTDTELEASRNEYALEHWGIPKITHEQFYSKMREQVQAEDKAEVVRNQLAFDMAKHVLEDQLGRTYTSDAAIFDKIAKANPEVITPENRDRWFLTSMAIGDQFRGVADRLREPAGQVLDAMLKVREGTATEADWDRAVDALRGVSQGDFNQILRLAAVASRSGEFTDMGEVEFFKNLQKRFGRDYTLNKIATRDQELLLNSTVENLAAGMTVGKMNGRLIFAPPGQALPPGATKLDDNEYAAYTDSVRRAQEGINLTRQLRNFQETVVDPVKPIFEGGVLGAAEAGMYELASFSKLLPLGLTNIVPVAGPIAGPMLVATAIAASTYDELRLQNPNLPIAVARDLSNFVGAINAIAFKIDIDFLRGRFPGLTTMRKSFAIEGALPTLRTYGKWAGMALLAEQSEEGIQDALEAITRKVFADMHPREMTQQSWMEVVSNWARERPTVLFATLAPAAIGSGVATWRDINNPARDFLNYDALKGTGFNDEVINRILGATDLDEAQRIARAEYNKLTAEDMIAGARYAAGLKEGDAVAGEQANPGTPTLEAVKQPDGTYQYQVKDVDGTVLSTHTDENVANLAWAREVERVSNERLAREAEAQVSEQAQIAVAEKEAELRMLPPVSRASASVVLEFEPDERPTPEQSESVRRLEAALAKDPRSGGEPISLVIQGPSRLGVETRYSKALKDTIAGFARIFGKEVIFVRSGTDRVLPFDGVILPERPNTIFLDADGHGNVLALLGHEWAHTLALTNPQLHRAMAEAMRPLVIDWLKQEGLLKEEGYGEGQVTEELISNIVGDSFTRPEFWAKFNRRNPSLFERVVRAIEEWFASIIATARGSEWGTEGFITSLEEMHGVISSAIEQARMAGPEVATAPSEAQVFFATKKVAQKVSSAWLKGEKNPAIAREKARDWWQEHQEGPVEVSNPHFRQPIIVSWQGVKHATRATAGLEESATVPYLTKLVAIASKVGQPEADRKGRKNIKAIHRLQTPVSFDGIPRTLGIVVRETTSGTLFYDHSYIKEEPIGMPGEQRPKPQSFQPAMGSEINKPGEHAEVKGLLFATKRGKFAQARAEGVSQKETIEAAYERLHAEPGSRIALLERSKAAYEKVRAENLKAQAAFQIPAPEDPQAAIDELDAQETKAQEDLDAEEQAALDQNTLNIGDRYGERIQAEQDPQRRRQLEREMKLVQAEQRRGIEKQFNERRKALTADFARQRQAVRTAIYQKNLAATKEGQAQLARMRNIHAFAELNAIVRSLPSAVRGQVGGALTLTQIGGSPERIVEFLAGRIAKIGEVLEKTLRAEYTARIKTLLATYKPKKVSGVKRSKLGDAQATVDRIRVVSKMTNDQVALEQESIDEQLSSSTDLTPEREAELTADQVTLQTFGAIDEMTAEELGVAHAELINIIKTGRAGFGAKEQERLEKYRANRDSIMTGIPKGTAAGIAEKERTSIKDFAKSVILSIYNFSQVIREVLPKSAKVVVDRWDRESARADTGSQDYIRFGSERFAQAIQGAIGSKSAIKAGDVIKNMQALTIDGKDGKASKFQAIQYLLSWAQKDVRARMEKKGWTQAHMDVFAQATADPASTAVKHLLREEYDRMYHDIDRVYFRVYGMHLPKVEFYAPTRYFHAGQEVDINPFGGPLSMAGTTPSFAMARVPHNAEIRQSDAMTVYLQHLHQVAHFIHYAELIRELRGTMNQPEVKMALQQKLGPMQHDVVSRWIDALARNGSNKGNETRLIQAFMKHVVSGKAISSLILNPKTVAMQVDSMLRFATAIPPRKLMRSIFDGTWVSNIPTAWYSDAVQRRLYGGMNPQVQFIMQKGNFTPSFMIELVRKGMMPIQYADAAFTSVSSAIVYSYAYREAIDAGRSQTEAEAIALEEMDRAVHQFSQPTGVTSKSILEVNTGGTMKLLMLFMSDPRLKSAVMAEAMLGLMRKENISQNIMRIVAIEAMALLSQYIACLYRDWATDDDDEDIWTKTGFARAVLLAPLQGIFTIGNMADSTIAWMLGEKIRRPGAVDPMTEGMQKVQSVFRNLDDLLNTADPQAMLREWDTVLKAAGLLGGPPAAGLNAVTNFLKLPGGVYENWQKKED